MSVEVGRRVFVGSVAAGLPFLTGGADVTWAQRESSTALLRDPVALQLIDDMKRAVRALSRASSGEQARRLASSLRLLAAWGASHDIDSRIQRTLRAVIASEGRDALLRREIDDSMFRDEARDVGFDGSSVVPLPIVPVADYAVRGKVLDDLLARGATARWIGIARLADAAAASLDRQASRGKGMLRVAQIDPADCLMIAKELEYLSAEMVFWCAPWFYWVPEPCGLVSAAYLGVWAVYWWDGCV